MYCLSYLFEVTCLWGAAILKTERIVLRCFPLSSLQTLVGSDKLQTEADLSLRFQTMVILSQDRTRESVLPQNNPNSNSAPSSSIATNGPEQNKILITLITSHISWLWVEHIWCIISCRNRLIPQSGSSFWATNSLFLKVNLWKGNRCSGKLLTYLIHTGTGGAALTVDVSSQCSGSPKDWHSVLTHKRIAGNDSVSFLYGILSNDSVLHQKDHWQCR